eukprot:CAMPEP_0176447206 /NCGR_PEP_ID=MMETSP0127-20121128/24870_1 /TAXON_ID=938130 /ORGANISM="Platyophrya macrostoma, Strain WH" /LENGTH=270 /DNA_ID=CAMNT_0017833561 /DNA_START=43 /DNA_END=855 /DNA_ORIENTATION=+
MERNESRHKNAEGETQGRSRRSERVPALFEVETRLQELRSSSSKKVMSQSADTHSAVCHICCEAFENKYVLRCGSKGCHEAYCLLCAVDIFKKTPMFIYLAFKSARWHCFACIELCQCKKCEDAKTIEDENESNQHEESVPGFQIRRGDNKSRIKEYENPKTVVYDEIRTDLGSEKSDTGSLVGILELSKRPSLPMRKIKAKAAMQEYLSRHSLGRKSMIAAFEKDCESDSESLDARPDREAIELEDNKFLNRKKRLWKQTGPVKNQIVC